MKNLIVLFISLSFISCALPAPEFEDQQFVPKKDIIANSIYQEGVELYRAGRLMDAELKMRQALFLFPKAENIRANLALVLKNNSQFEEANSIYKDLIKRYPEAYDYRFALAESYYRERKFDEAAGEYYKAMLGFEKDNDVIKAAQSARSIASLYFLKGDERKALCGSSDSVVYAPIAEQIIRHVRMLVAFSQPELAYQSLSPLIEKVNDVKDPSLLKLAAIVFFANEKIKETKDFLDLAVENQKAGLKDGDAELNMIREVFLYKYPEEIKEGEEDIEISDEEDEKATNLVFNEQNVLYWPGNLVDLYYEFKATLVETE